MNGKIVNNLYEFWELIGQITGNLIVADDYKAVSIPGSDWPSRIFSVKNDESVYNKMVSLSNNNKLPDKITVQCPDTLNVMQGISPLLEQKNMAISLNMPDYKLFNYKQCIPVETEKDSVDFALTATTAFGYGVDWKTVYTVVSNTEKIKAFNYMENSKCLGCGIVFFDSYSIAGLHMIGTLPEGRGKGIGRKMTEQLLFESKKRGADNCVLHASVMGEPIYRKLGFKGYGKLHTYKIMKR